MKLLFAFIFFFACLWKVTPFSNPSSYPAGESTSGPSSFPSEVPIESPFSSPSTFPTDVPSSRPTSHPTLKPSSQPTAQPTSDPSGQPTQSPLAFPSSRPSRFPSAAPTSTPTNPTTHPTGHPSRAPTAQPSSNPTNPTSAPTAGPTRCPTAQPSSNPTSPTGQPTSQPSRHPSGQPTSNPTNPSSQPTSHPSAKPSDIPTISPKPAEVIQYDWMFDPEYGVQLSVIIAISINGLGIVLCVFLLYCTKDTSPEWREFIGAICCILVNFVNFLFLCAKFDYFLKRQDEFKFYTTKDNVYVWPNSGYWSANKETLEAANCPYSLDRHGRIEPLDRSNGNVCQWLALSFSGDLIANGMIQFSIGLGLILFFGLQCLAFGAKLAFRNMFRDGNNDNILRKMISYCSGYSMKYIVTLIISSQQFCVMMLLTNVQANDYCGYFVTPASLSRTICLYQYGVYSLPWSIIFGICTALSGLLVYVFKDGGGNAFTVFLAFCALAAFAFCAIHFVSLFGYWLFAGFGVGVWFQFASLEVSLRFVVVEGLSFMVFIINDLFDLCNGCVAHAHTSDNGSGDGGDSNQRAGVYSEVAAEATGESLDHVSERRVQNIETFELAI